MPNYNEVVSLEVSLKNGVTYNIATVYAEAHRFHKRFTKHIRGLCTTTDQFLMHMIQGHVILSTEVASYRAVDSKGKYVDLGSEC